MSSGPGAFSRHNHLEELNDPLVTNEGVLSPTQRKTLARTALGTGTVVTAVAAPAAFSAAYVQAELNALRTALINAGVLTA